MRKFILIALSASLAVFITWAADWPSQSGNPQRDGWAKAEKAFTKENAKNIELLYKYSADNQTKSLMALTTPIINGNLITYLGFKEMLVFGGSQDKVYSVDADLNRRIWETHFEYKADKPALTPTAVCPGGLTASLAMPGSSTAAGRGGAPPGRGRDWGRRSRTGGRGRSATAGTRSGAPANPAVCLPAGNFGRAGIFIAIGSDGYLHALNTSTGTDKVPAVHFLPANSKVNGLNINDGVIYAATDENCGGNPNGLYALDMSGAEHTVSVFETNGAGPAGSGGTAISADGTIYAQIPDGRGDVAGNYNDTVVAFSKDLKVKDYFTPSGEPVASKKSISTPGITPVVFAWKGKDMVVAAGRNGRVYLLDGSSLAGADHHTPLAETEPVASPDLKYEGNGFAGTFSSWESTEDADNPVRWIYAPLQGPLNPSAKIGHGNGDYVAWQRCRIPGRRAGILANPRSLRVWASRDMMATPAPPVTANGLVFALARGESSREEKENGKALSIAEREKMASHATLFVLDGATGAELYSSGNIAATAFAHNSGQASRSQTGESYFTTHDNLVRSSPLVLWRSSLS